MHLLHNEDNPFGAAQSRLHNRFDRARSLVAKRSLLLFGKRRVFIGCGMWRIADADRKVNESKVNEIA